MAMLHYVDDRPIILTENGAWEQGGDLFIQKWRCYSRPR